MKVRLLVRHLVCAASCMVIELPRGEVWLSQRTKIIKIRDTMSEDTHVRTAGTALINAVTNLYEPYSFSWALLPLITE